MATAVVTIAGRTYRMSCADGEEQRLEALAKSVEEKIETMRAGFGDIGEQRIVVMAAIAIADEATDAELDAARAAGMATALAERPGNRPAECLTPHDAIGSFAEIII